MRRESLQFLKAIVNEPSPSGYEEGAAQIYRDYTSPYADSITTDSHGNVFATINPKAEMKIMLAGHMDEIGFLIHYISPEGLLYFSQVGGHDSAVIVGQRVWVHGKKRIPGAIGRKPIHMLSQDDRKKSPEMKDMWIDIGVSSKEEAEKLVNLGDPVTYQWEFQMLQGDNAVARGFDNKMGSFVVGEALRLVKESGKLHKGVGVYAVSTVQEEIGLRGARTSAFTTAAQSGIAVDVNHAIDYPGVDKKEYGEMTVGKGPTHTRGANINPVVFQMVCDAAKKHDIPYQIEASAGATGTDANAMQLSRGGMATGLLGVPVRYMHTPCELLSLSDVENCAKLMAAYCEMVKPETDFTPKRKK